MKTIEAFREETRFLKEEDTNPNATARKDPRMHVGGATASILDIRDMMNVEFTKITAVVVRVCPFQSAMPQNLTIEDTGMTGMWNFETSLSRPAMNCVAMTVLP